MAEVLLAARLRGLTPSVVVGSAGLLGGGQPASPNAVAVMAERGLDLGAHRSRELTAEMVGDADLILGLARQHVREACVLEATAWGRTFTVKELVRRTIGAPSRRAGQSLDSSLVVIREGRRLNDLLGSDPVDDVADPIGESLETYRRTADELDGLVARLVGWLWPDAAVEGAA